MAKGNSTSIQVVVYDMGGNPLPSSLVKQVENEVAKVIRNFDSKTVAYTTVIG